MAFWRLAAASPSFPKGLPMSTSDSVDLSVFPTEGQVYLAARVKSKDLAYRIRSLYKRFVESGALPEDFLSSLTYASERSRFKNYLLPWLASNDTRSSEKASAENNELEAFMRLFINRTDTYAKQRSDGLYIRVQKPLTIDVLKRHLNHEETVGAYQINPNDNTVKWICFDVDPEHVEDPLKTALDIYEPAKEAFSEKAVWLEASRYPDKSYHVWVFFEPPLDAGVARFLGHRVLQLAGSPNIELFPKQEKVGREGFGNLVKLPLGLHQKARKPSHFLDPSTLNPLPNSCMHKIEGCTLLDKEINRIKSVIKGNKEAKNIPRSENREAYQGPIPACIKAMMDGVEEGLRNEAGVRLASFLLNFQKKDQDEAWMSFIEWNQRNKPQLDERELKTLFNSVRKGEYRYGCDDEILKSFCKDRNKCFLAKAEEPTFGPEIIDFVVNHDLLQEIFEHLSKAVKKDEVLKRLIPLVGLSAFYKNPINLFLKGPSSIGKTYNATEGLKYFPDKDTWFLGSLSPTALVHDYGTYDEERRVYVVDLEGKILVFLEAPPLETYARLRPVLSHDKLEITYKFTDKRQKKGLKTRTVIIRGWPATVFCTTEAKYIEYLATRGFTATPEINAEKYKQAIRLKGEKDAFPFKFSQDEELEKLRKGIELLTHMAKKHKLGVVIPYGPELSEVYPYTLARDMRDFDRLRSLIQMNALFHLFQRPVLQILENDQAIAEYIIATQEDYETAKALTLKILETTRVGLPGNVIDFYRQVVVPVCLNESGFATYRDLMHRFKEVYGYLIGRSQIYKNYTQPLEQTGWIAIEPHPTDKRMRIIIAVKKAESLGEFFAKEFLEFFNEEKLKNWLDSISFPDKRAHIVKFVNVDKTQALNMEPDFRQRFFAMPKQVSFKETGSEKEGKSLVKDNQRICEKRGKFQPSLSFEQVLSGPHIVACVISEQKECPGCGEKRILNRSITTFGGSTIRICHECADKVEDALRRRVENG